MTPELAEYLRTTDLPLRPLIDALPYGILIATENGTICFWNQGAEKQFDYTKEEAVGQNLMLLMPDRFKQAHETALKRRKENNHTGDSKILGNTIQIFGKAKDGLEFPIELSVIYHKINDKWPAYMAIICDVTDQHMMVMAKMLARNFSELNNHVIKAEASLDNSIKEESKCPFHKS